MFEIKKNLWIGFILFYNISNAQIKPEYGCVKFVSPFIGTGAVDNSSLSGNNFPGATLPFAFLQVSPDTQDAPEHTACGYDYNDKTIVGFSQDHLSGTGVADLLDVLLMPTVGEIKLEPGKADVPRSGYRSAFSHIHEKAWAGYYQVLLQDYDINAELTSTSHVGMHRYSFPASKEAHIIIDLDHSLSKQRTYWPCRILGAELRVVNDHAIEGYRILTGWAKLRRVYFYAEFSRPFTGNVMDNGLQRLNNTPLINGTKIRAALNFDTREGKEVLVKVALSPVSIENARENMKAELPGWDFDAVSKAATGIWEQELSKIQIEGTTKQKEIFYTGLYHALIQPNNVADINGQYQANDLTVAVAPDKTHYSTLSLWDTYRAANPLYTIIEPEKAAAFVNSMLRQYSNYGYLPIWQLWGDETYCMIGNHAVPVVTDAVLKGLPGIDANKAFEAVKASLTIDHPNSVFRVLDSMHYIPEDVQSQSVSIALETAYDDWCAAQLAAHLGKTADYKFFTKRAGFYRNLFNKNSGFFQAKNKNGGWKEPFNPLDYGGNGGSPYTEGNAWQYLWYVPQNVPDLINLLGGKEAFNKKLDQFFTLKDRPDQINESASGLIGQYAHGNEPSHHIAYLYDYSGEPWKTQYYVSKIVNELYNNSSAGYAGNEDCGQMASWYIFSSMGIYPVNPAGGIYVIGAPTLKSTQIKGSNGNIFETSAENVSPANCYIQSVTVNGKAYNKTYITQKQLDQGVKIHFTMGPKPNMSWGTGQESAPPVSSWGNM